MHVHALTLEAVERDTKQQPTEFVFTHTHTQSECVRLALDHIHQNDATQIATINKNTQ